MIAAAHPWGWPQWTMLAILAWDAYAFVCPPRRQVRPRSAGRIALAVLGVVGALAPLIAGGFFGGRP